MLSRLSSLFSAFLDLLGHQNNIRLFPSPYRDVTKPKTTKSGPHVGVRAQCMGNKKKQTRHTDFLQILNRPSAACMRVYLCQNMVAKVTCMM